MSKKVYLFSPIGNTDPIRKCHDGAMLHIARNYKVDKIFLYMSKDILKNENHDHRYTIAIDNLSKTLDKEISYEIIERPDLEDVHKFDQFFEDFRSIIDNISKELEHGDTLLVNVSSGTPAMKGALLTIATLDMDSYKGNFNCKIIQVSDPEHTIGKNFSDRKSEYDIKEEIANNHDSADNFKNRCEQVKCPSLRYIKNKKNVESLIKSYNYFSAYNLAVQSDLTETKLLVAIALRTQFKLDDAKEILKAINKEDIFSSERLSDDPFLNKKLTNIVEYTLLVDIKWKRKEYGDFIRALSPLIYDLFILMLINVCKFDVKAYTKNNELTYWDEDLINPLSQDKKGQEIYSILKSRFKNIDTDLKSPIKSTMLYTLIENYCKDFKVIELCKILRKDIESKVRNIAANEIATIDDDFIKEKTHLTSGQIMNKIKEAFMYTPIFINLDEDTRTKKFDEMWKTYDNLNKILIKNLK